MGKSATPGAGKVSTAMLGERLKRLRQRMNSAGIDRPLSWSAQPGDTLLGEFVRWETGTTRRGEEFRIAIIADAESGELRSVWTFYVALRSELKQADPQPGDLLGITRLDDGAAAKSRQQYRRYRVEVER
jgi:hypothetical protein